MSESRSERQTSARTAIDLSVINFRTGTGFSKDIGESTSSSEKWVSSTDGRGAMSSGATALNGVYELDDWQPR